MKNYANDAGREFGWDDEIQNDSPDLCFCRKANIPSRSQNFERQRHPGSAKLRPAPWPC